MATVIRLCHVAIPIGSRDNTRPYGDPSWRWRWVPLWSQIEVCVGIIAASLPSLSPLLKQMWTDLAHPRTLSPTRNPTIREPGFRNRAQAEEGHQKLPSTFSSLPNKSVTTLGTLANSSFTTLGDLENAKRLTFYDDGHNSEEEEGEDTIDCDAFPDPYGTTQVGVARAINTRLSRGAFVDIPASPRKDGFLAPSAPGPIG